MSEAKNQGAAKVASGGGGAAGGGTSGPETMGPSAAQAWWRKLAPREQRLLAVGGAVLALGLLWWLLVQPAWRTLQRAPAELEVLDNQLQTMRAQATEAEQLRAAPAVTPEQAAAVLRGAAERLGAKAKLSLQGERAVLTLTALEPGALNAWLAEVRSGARARPLEANLTRAGAGYSGTLVLALKATP